MTSRPSAIVFDLGKVLLDFDYGIAATALAPHSAAPADTIRSVLDQSPLLFELECGQISADEFTARVCHKIGFRGTSAQFRAAFAEIFTEIRDMVGLHAQVRAAGFPTFILSNTNDIAIDHIRRRFPFFAHFTGYVFSHEVRSMKPEPAIYSALEQTTGCHGPQILYLDDRLENVDAALARGWLALHHTTPGPSIAAVQNALGL